MPWTALTADDRLEEKLLDQTEKQLLGYITPGSPHARLDRLKTRFPLTVETTEPVSPYSRQPRLLSIHHAPTT